MGPKLTPLQLELLHMIVKEVREFGKANAPSYLGMLPQWREIVDGVLEDHDEAEQPFSEIFDSVLLEPASKNRRLHS